MLMGIWLMIVGMGVVFLFLGLLVFMMNVLSSLLEPYAHLIPDASAPAKPAAPRPAPARPAPAVAAAPDLKPVVAAIAAAQHAGK